MPLQIVGEIGLEIILAEGAFALEHIGPPRMAGGAVEVEQLTATGEISSHHLNWRPKTDQKSESKRKQAAHGHRHRSPDYWLILPRPAAIVTNVAQKRDVNGSPAPQPRQTMILVALKQQKNLNPFQVRG